MSVFNLAGLTSRITSDYSQNISKSCHDSGVQVSVCRDLDDVHNRLRFNVGRSTSCYACNPIQYMLSILQKYRQKKQIIVSARPISARYSLDSLSSNRAPPDPKRSISRDVVHKEQLSPDFNCAYLITLRVACKSPAAVIHHNTQHVTAPEVKPALSAISGNATVKYHGHFKLLRILLYGGTPEDVHDGYLHS